MRLRKSRTKKTNNVREWLEKDPELFFDSNVTSFSYSELETDAEDLFEQYVKWKKSKSQEVLDLIKWCDALSFFGVPHGFTFAPDERFYGREHGYFCGIGLRAQNRPLTLVKSTNTSGSDQARPSKTIGDPIGVTNANKNN